jgi:hypothetical protein
LRSGQIPRRVKALDTSTRRERVSYDDICLFSCAIISKKWRVLQQGAYRSNATLAGDLLPHACRIMKCWCDRALATTIDWFVHFLPTSFSTPKNAGTECRQRRAMLQFQAPPSWNPPSKNPPDHSPERPWQASYTLSPLLFLRQLHLACRPVCSSCSPQTLQSGHSS